MRRDSRLASQKARASAARSTVQIGWNIPKTSTAIVARLTEMRSTDPSESRFAQYTVFSKSVRE